MQRSHSILVIVLFAMIMTSACAPKPQFADFSPDNFDNSTDINNLWLPLRPGQQQVYEGTALDKDVFMPIRRIEFTVTDLTKEIAGVRTVVTWRVVYDDGEVVKKEIGFYAQDNDGNVWYLGEYVEAYENREFVKAPTWIHGLEDASAGIKMMAEPQLGTPSYYEGWGPAVGWSRYGKVDQIDEKLCIHFNPISCTVHHDVVVIAESSLDKEGAFQLRYYAPGVGEVQVGWRGAEEVREELAQIHFGELLPEDLAEIRAEALKLEKHAYEISKDVYGQTSPMK